jgi:hypothetical protein
MSSIHLIQFWLYQNAIKAIVYKKKNPLKKTQKTTKPKRKRSPQALFCSQ